MEKRELYRTISDCFAVPGLLCLFLGALRWMTGQGAFHGLSYILKNAMCLLTFQERKPYEPAKAKQNGSAVLLLTGMVLLAAAGVFAGLYYG